LPDLNFEPFGFGFDRFLKQCACAEPHSAPARDGNRAASESVQAESAASVSPLKADYQIELEVPQQRLHQGSGVFHIAAFLRTHPNRAGPRVVGHLYAGETVPLFGEFQGGRHHLQRCLDTFASFAVFGMGDQFPRQLMHLGKPGALLRRHRNDEAELREVGNHLLLHGYAGLARLHASSSSVTMAKVSARIA
jgi:hypothetical protein